jgi:hypothetical protein
MYLYTKVWNTISNLKLRFTSNLLDSLLNSLIILKEIREFVSIAHDQVSETHLFFYHGLRIR